MPSQIIHFLAGHGALMRCGEGQTFLHTPAFNIGCQGPDVFSHNRRTKPFALAFSRLLHRHDYGRFCGNVGTIIRKKKSPLLESWFLGFTTHQIVDRIFHPYIINRSFVTSQTDIPGVTPALFHAFFERILDVLVLEQISCLSLPFFDTGQPFTLSPAEITVLAEAIASSLELTYPSHIPLEGDIILRVENALKDTIYFYDVTNPLYSDMNRTVGRFKIKYFEALGIGGVALLYPQFLDESKDWMNAARNGWKHPVSGNISTQSVEDLFIDALNRTEAMMKRVLSFLNGNGLPDDLENMVGNECLSISGPDGSIASVQFSEPFDLASVLRSQVELRRVWLAPAIG